ncbi:ABC transporter ATP-binding protein [Candidatus Saccharibacteria bacterium]|nr:ABC transporter ATP-binding protein [Candidatus Saccharibacteria bacterium]
MNVIETSKLTKYYGKDRGIIDLDLQVQEGEIFGFIGPNGAGKSTTIRTLLSIIHPTSGSATIFGEDVTKYGPDIRQEVGYLPSEVFYYDSMKAIDLLRYSASFYDRPKAQTDARIKKLAEILNLDLNKKIEDLSFGNKKKVGIIQGLLHEPRLIILDEPTSGLDPLIQQKFFNLVKEENQRGASVLFSSHILGEVQRLCSRVGIIKEGKLIKVEKLSDLQKNSTKRFRLSARDQLDKQLFSAIKGVSEVTQADKELNFLYRGNLQDVTKVIAKLDLTNLEVSEPDLEEIFLHYYK